MNTWWKVADMVEARESKDLQKVEFGLEVVVSSEMPEEVRHEAERLLHDVEQLRARLKMHAQHVLSKMDGVMWPVI
jgi:hypothetical protein